MNILGVIPSRFASTRFPGKPLAVIGGESMISRVYRQCQKTGVLSDIMVATEDQRIYDHVLAFGGKAMLTSPEHQSGTDRIGEVIGKLETSFDVVINIQGDEPFIDPDQIQMVTGLFQNPETQIATLMKKMGEEDPSNPNIVKVVTDVRGMALYFSRSIIPFPRNGQHRATFFKHLGIYGYRTSVLKELINLKPSRLEIIESLEQLRWLEAGYRIQVAETFTETIAVDTPEDLERVEKMMKS